MADAPSESLGKRIREERRKHLWTQKELAARIGVTELTVIRWENGQAMPRQQQIDLLTEAFGRPPEEWGNARQIRWNVPLRNRYFTGRHTILEKLHQAIADKQGGALSQAWGLTGLGGIGKTAAAIEYIYRYGPEYEAIFWIGADTSETLLSDFTSLALALDLPVQQERDQHRIVSLVKRWLEQHGPWLLVFDNADDLNLASRYWPGRANGSVLLTTRSQATGSHIEPIETDKMSREEGIRFLLHRIHRLHGDKAQDLSSAGIDREEQEEAGKLWECMDGLPLALAHAADYLEETRCTLSDYLDMFETSRKVLLSRRSKASEHPEPVAVTWLMALDKIEQGICPAAGDLLRLCAFLHADAMPESMIRKGVLALAPVLQSLATEKAEWNEAIAELHRYSLVKRKPWKKLLTMHRLVQAVIRDDMDQETLREWAERAVRVVDAAFPDPKSGSSWSQYEHMMPHAELAAEYVEEYHILSEVAGRLLYKLASYLQDHARYTEAEPLYQRALRIQDQQLGSEHPDVASTLDNLANLYTDQGKYAEAESLFLRALRIRERFLSPEHPEMASTLNNLANLYHLQGKYTDAELLYQRAVRTWEQFGPENPDRAAPLNGLANICMAQGRYAEAEPLYRQALRIREQLGPEYPRPASALNNLANLYQLQGRYTEAEPLYQRALGIWEQQLGSEHPLVASPLNNLAELYRGQGKFAEAEPLYQRALDIWEQQFGPESPDVAHPLNGLANLYAAQGKYDDAESLFLRALHIREKQLGLGHPDTAETLQDYAAFQKLQGNQQEARSLYQRALSIREQTLGAQHPQTTQTRARLKSLLDAMGLHEEAAELEAVQSAL